MGGEWKRFFWFPVLLPAYPAVFVASRNIGEFENTELAVIVMALLGAGLIVYVAVHLALRQRCHPHGIAIISTLIAASLFLIVAVTEEIGGRLGIPEAFRGYLVMAMIAVTAGLVLLIIRRGQTTLEGPTRALRIFTYVILTVAGVQLALDSVQAGNRVRTSAFVSSRLALPSEAKAGPKTDKSASQRDVYLIVLDKYANSEMLRQQLSFSNAAFSDSLRHLGFIVPDNARTNYAYTWFSLASLLNFVHVTGVDDSLGAAGRLGLRYMIEHNRTVDFLKQHGYRYYFLPSHMFVSTRRDPRADVEIGSPRSAPLRALISKSQLAHTVWQQSLPGRIARIWGYDVRYPERELEIFDSLERIAAEPGPKFVFAHVMLPHEPFFYDARCRITGLIGRDELDDRAYLEQIRCTNDLLLHLTSVLLARSAVAPIILFQADHGTTSPSDGVSPTNQDARRAERFRGFAAYSLPGGGANAYDPEGTPVNLMRFILNYYFGASLPALPNQSYWIEE